AGCGAIVAASELIPEGERVLNLNPYGYYLREDLFACSSNWLDYLELLQTYQGQGPTAYWEHIWREGVRYVIIAPELHMVRRATSSLGVEPDTAPDWLNIDAIHEETIYSSDHSTDWVSIYRLSAVNAPVESVNTCSL